MTGGNDLILSIPNKTVQRQQASGNVQHRAGRLLGGTWVYDSNAAVVTGEGKSITTRGETDTLNPASRVIQEFTTDGVERKTLAPGTGLRTGINTLDEAGQDTGVRIGGARCQQHRVRVPCKCCDGTPNGLLQMFRNPPIVLLLEVADGNNAGSRANGELLLGGRPADKSSGTVNSEKDQGRFPAGGGLLPDISIAVCLSIVDLISSSSHGEFPSINVPCEQVTMRPLFGAISTLVTVFSWPFSSSLSVNLLPDDWYSSTLFSRATASVCLSDENE